MSESELLSPRQVSEYLSASAQEVSRLVEEGKLTAYRIGGAYLRFRRDEIISFREKYLRARQQKKQPQVSTNGPKTEQGAAHRPGKLTAVGGVSWGEQFSEFWYFNNFYVYSFILMGIFVWFIFK